MNQWSKALLPPILLNILRIIINNKYGWKGHYLTWEEALHDSTGYDTQEILQKVKKASLQVKKNEAIYERDSVIFENIQYSWPLLAGIMFSSIKRGINVVDFGGSLGSSYYQNRKFLDKIDDVSWSIIEQKHFVDVGKKEFEDSRLKFYYNISECMTQENPNLLLLSSVLQYIRAPYDLLNKLLKYNFEYILIDRTPFIVGKNDRIKLQIVPKNIYKASYPCWFFDENLFKNYFVDKGYKLIEEFVANDGNSEEYSFKGMLWGK